MAAYTTPLGTSPGFHAYGTVKLVNHTDPAFFAVAGESFEALVRARRSRLVNVAERIVLNRADAQDIVQEAFMRMAAARHTFAERAAQALRALASPHVPSGLRLRLVLQRSAR